MSILIGADVVPTQTNLELFNQGDARSLVGDDLYEVLQSASYRIFNMEVPLTDTTAPILKVGPSFSAPTTAVNGYKALGVDLLTLANNHILDQGEVGLASAIATLDRQKINHVGAGANLEEAKKPFIFHVNGKAVGVYACVEHEFSFATDKRGGANPFEPLYSLDDVSQLKQSTDYVIVLYHGGREQYRYPSPRLQKVCRRFIEKGADLVICQHSHCIGCEEKYGEGTIVYGQGNFLFDRVDNEYWNTSILISIDESMQVHYLPLVRAQNGVRIADENTGRDILAAFHQRSDEIQTPGFIESNYNEEVKLHAKFYLNTLTGRKSVVFKIIDRLSHGALFKKFFHRRFPRKETALLMNYIQCEAHSELLIQILSNTASINFP